MPLGIMRQRHRISRLMPLETLGLCHCPVLQPVLDPGPIYTLMESVAVRRGLVMLVDPIVRDDAWVEVAHDPLTKVVDTVLVMTFVHLRRPLLVGFRLGKIGGVVVLPDVV